VFVAVVRAAAGACLGDIDVVADVVREILDVAEGWFAQLVTVDGQK